VSAARKRQAGRTLKAVAAPEPKPVPKFGPTMEVRPDGSRFPNRVAQNAVLADISDQDCSSRGPGYDYQITLGDLIVEALVGRDLNQDHDAHAEEWESLEHAMLRRTALELRALNVALAAGLMSDDDPPCDLFTTEDACELVQGLARRIRAGAELALRLREARWGHPNFGGGETRASEAKTKHPVREVRS
jgi:hypothetical protein